MLAMFLKPKCIIQALTSNSSGLFVQRQRVYSVYTVKAVCQWMAVIQNTHVLLATTWLKWRGRVTKLLNTSTQGWVKVDQLRSPNFTGGKPENCVASSGCFLISQTNTSKASICILSVGQTDRCSNGNMISDATYGRRVGTCFHYINT